MRACRHDRLGGQGRARVGAFGARPNMISLLFIVLLSETYEDNGGNNMWRKRSIPTHSGWLYPLTFDAGKGLKEA